MQQTKLKRIVIKEEYVALLNCPKAAVILGQFMYWIDKRYDYKDFFIEEKENYLKDLQVTESIDVKHGWIYKKSEELAEETLLCANATTIRRIITKIVEKGYLLERRNPKYRYDRTFQYRPNTNLILKDLNELGFRFNYEMLVNQDNHRRIIDINLQNSGIDIQKASTNLYYRMPKLQNAGAIPEITSETTSTDSTTINLIQQVGTKFLQLSNKQELDSKDIEAIKRLIDADLELQEILSLTEKCFKDYKGDSGIWSFKYVEKYIFDQTNAADQNKGDMKDGGFYTTTTKNGQAKTTARGTVWSRKLMQRAETSNLDCDF